MREVVKSDKEPSSYIRGERLAPLSSRLLAGLYRGIPQLIPGSSETPWDSISAEERIFNGASKGIFEVKLFESDGKSDAFRDGTPIEGLTAGRKALIRRDTADDEPSEAVVDFKNGHFVVRGQSGILAYRGTDSVSIEPSDSHFDFDVLQDTKSFVSDFIASTPEYVCGSVRRARTSAAAGRTALAGTSVQAQATA